ncbi:MAG: Na(+)/H(+) antiporter subunit B [Desulfohalobiaceae bacterium]|nr:Na(+)/H(+) antiporter subunit B [Desulfohalobiaceae bacterium]
MKRIGLIVVILCGAVLLYATRDFPAWGDPASPASTHVSPHYIEHALQETEVPNLVTAVLADYRSYDTMFETLVIFGAGVACFLLLRSFGARRREGWYVRHIPTGVVIHFRKRPRIPHSRFFERLDTEWVPHDLIIMTICRILLPFIQLFSLYVVAHGDFSPGGGFQGGVMFGASLVLMAISFDLRTALSRVGERILALLAFLGVVLYGGIGVLCMLLGGEFLDYSELAKILPVHAEEARALGMIGVEVGVGIAVTAVMAVIYVNIASAGRHDEGL